MSGPVARRPLMSDYGVPADPGGTLPWSWAEERLARCRNYWVVTVSATGRPHALPVWGVWRPEPATFAFSCGSGARKVRNMAANAQVCVAVDDTVECVSVEGLAAPLTDPAERAGFLDRYVDKYAEPDGRADLADFVGGQAWFVVRPLRAIAVIERADEFSERATAWDW